MLHCVLGIWRRQTLNSELQRPHYIMSLWTGVLEKWTMRVWQPWSFEDSTTTPTDIYTGYYTRYSASMGKNGSFWVTSTKSESDVLIQHREVCFKLKGNYELSRQNLSHWKCNLNSKGKPTLKICFILVFNFLSFTQKSQTTKKQNTQKTPNPNNNKIPLLL